MSEQIDTTVDMNEMLKKDIIRNTPYDQDPLIYWHQVAMDAIKTADREREKAKHAVEERNKMDNDLTIFTNQLITQAASDKSSLPLDISRLVDMARCGDIDLNVSIGIYGKGGADK